MRTIAIHSATICKTGAKSKSFRVSSLLVQQQQAAALSSSTASLPTRPPFAWRARQDCSSSLDRDVACHSCACIPAPDQASVLGRIGFNEQNLATTAAPRNCWLRFALPLCGFCHHHACQIAEYITLPKTRYVLQSFGRCEWVHLTHLIFEQLFKSSWLVLIIYPFLPAFS